MKAIVNAEQKKKAITRPLILEINDAKAEIVQIVNSALQKRGLPCYMVADILENVLGQIREGARKELAAAKAQEAKNIEEDKK